MKLPLCVICVAFPLLAMADPAEDFDRGYALAQEKGCFDCHQLGSRDVGPSFRAIAQRYRYDVFNRRDLPIVIRGGSIGHWGERFAMWPQRQVTGEEARILTEWVLAQ
jgi:cytochrome c